MGHKRTRWIGLAGLSVAVAAGAVLWLVFAGAGTHTVQAVQVACAGLEGVDSLRVSLSDVTDDPLDFYVLDVRMSGDNFHIVDKVSYGDEVINDDEVIYSGGDYEYVRTLTSDGWVKREARHEVEKFGFPFSQEALCPNLQQYAGFYTFTYRGQESHRDLGLKGGPATFHRYDLYREEGEWTYDYRFWLNDKGQMVRFERIETDPSYIGPLHQVFLVSEIGESIEIAPPDEWRWKEGHGPGDVEPRPTDSPRQKAAK